MIEERTVQGRKDPKTGKVSKPTVRYDVRYRGPDGKERSKTFRSKKDAEKYERAQRTALDQGVWLDPRKATETLKDYANRWLDERHDLRPRTAELYRSLLRVHLVPRFGAMSLAKLSAQSSAVRTWNAELARQHASTAAKAYRLLSQLCSTAVTDGLIGRSPCNVKGAGQEHSPERPTATISEVFALADAMPPDMRLIVLLAAWCQLRRGELLGLQRNDFDLLHRDIRIERSVSYVDGSRQVGPPKTEAGMRSLKIPAFLMPDIEEHLRRCVSANNDAVVFTGPMGHPLRPGTLDAAFKVARRTIGRPELTLHCLRHSGLTWSAATGATAAELMRRAGHKSATAAMRYQHATTDRDAVLAEALSAMAQAAPAANVSESPRDVRGNE